MSHTPGTTRFYGQKLLILGPEAEQQSQSDSTLMLVERLDGRLRELSYTWAWQGEPKQGLLWFLVDEASGAASGAWVDSWHQSTSILALKGQRENSGRIDLLGHYSVPGHPDWGWRIGIEVRGSSLLLEMFNREPEGHEDLAVRIEARAG